MLLNGDPGLELRAEAAAPAHRWEPPFRGYAPPRRLTMGPVQKKQSASICPGPRLQEGFSLLWIKSLKTQPTVRFNIQRSLGR